MRVSWWSLPLSLYKLTRSTDSPTRFFCHLSESGRRQCANMEGDDSCKLARKLTGEILHTLVLTVHDWDQVYFW
jgi:hypothetical protein